MSVTISERQMASENQMASERLSTSARPLAAETVGATAPTHPSLRALEPLLRLDATVRRDPDSSRSQTGLRRRNTFRLQREDEVETLLRGRGDEGVSAAGGADADGRRPTELATRRAERRQVLAVARLICQATMETLAGRRPVQQLGRWLDPEVFAKVRERSELLRHTRELNGPEPGASPAVRRPLLLRRVRAHPVGSGAWEVSVIFTDEARTRACAMRLEAHRGRWRAAALELG